jgi:hypothetical protein
VKGEESRGESKGQIKSLQVVQNGIPIESERRIERVNGKSESHLARAHTLRNVDSMADEVIQSSFIFTSRQAADALQSTF